MSAAPFNPWAFPQTGKEVEGGMTLRDVFAGQWLQGYMASDIMDLPRDKAAEAAYAMADAMLQARLK